MLAVEEPISTVLVIVPSLPEAVDKGDDEAAGVVSRVAVDESPAEAAVLVDIPLTKSGSLVAAELRDKVAVDVCTTEESVLVATDVNISEVVPAAAPDEVWLDELLEVSSGDKVLVTVDEDTEERLVRTFAEVSDDGAPMLETSDGWLKDVDMTELPEIVAKPVVVAIEDD
ncbi:hypothetical protein LQW54_010778 [Pestalotiopsis sp. IQ-011]